MAFNRKRPQWARGLPRRPRKDVVKKSVRRYGWLDPYVSDGKVLKKDQLIACGIGKRPVWVDYSGSVPALSGPYVPTLVENDVVGFYNGTCVTLSFKLPKNKDDECKNDELVIFSTKKL